LTQIFVELEADTAVLVLGIRVLFAWESVPGAWLRVKVIKRAVKVAIVGGAEL